MRMRVSVLPLPASQSELSRATPRCQLQASGIKWLCAHDVRPSSDDPTAKVSAAQDDEASDPASFLPPSLARKSLIMRRLRPIRALATVSASSAVMARHKFASRSVTASTKQPSNSSSCLRAFSSTSPTASPTASDTATDTALSTAAAMIDGCPASAFSALSSARTALSSVSLSACCARRSESCRRAGAERGHGRASGNGAGPRNAGRRQEASTAS